MSVMTKRQRVRKIEAALDAEKLKQSRAKEVIAKLRVELKHARASK